MQTRQEKIVIIGANGFNVSSETSVVRCVDWRDLSNGVNLSDNDVVILNLLDFSDKERDAVSWSRVFETLNTQAMLNVLKHSGDILIVGDPCFYVSMDSNYYDNKITMPFLFWTGLEFEWNNQSGDTIERSTRAMPAKFHTYLDRLKRWSYSLKNWSETQALDKLQNQESYAHSHVRVGFKENVYALNRHSALIFFSIQMGLYALSQYGHQNECRWGSLFFFPEIASSSEETLQLILQEFCSVEIELPEPEWAFNLVAPNQLEIDSQIDVLQQDSKILKAKLEDAFSARETARECLKLLYERELSLEPVVRKVLAVLGATVEEPIEPNKEDGWISVSIGDVGHRGVLEIKSIKNDHFDERGRKQLHDWIGRGVESREIKYKGIFIGNSAVARPPEERVSPFSDSWIKACKLHDMCALTTKTLYDAYVLHVEGKLDHGRFWTELFQTSGLFQFKA